MTPDPLQPSRMFVFKLDGATGAELWRVDLGPTADLGISGVAADSGNIYVAGQTPGNGGQTGTMVAKLDDDGNQLWREEFMEPGLALSPTTDLVLLPGNRLAVSGVAGSTSGGAAAAFVYILGQN